MALQKTVFWEVDAQVDFMLREASSTFPEPKEFFPTSSAWSVRQSKRARSWFQAAIPTRKATSSLSDSRRTAFAERPERGSSLRVVGELLHDPQ